MRINTGNNANGVVLPELSYAIIGAAFSVFNTLGYGLHEKDYQKALALELSKAGLTIQKEVYIPIRYKDRVLSKYFADFLINKEIILELKVTPKLGYENSRQLLNYLRTGGFRLGILLYFTEEGVKYRRVLNSKSIRTVSDYS